MPDFSRKIFLVPLLTLFLLLTLDVFLISRMAEVPSLYRENPSLRFPAFRTTDLNGVPVTDEIFNGNFSVVCLWVTKDAASRELLAALSAWKAASPKRFQLVGIVGDVRDTDDVERIAAARSIARDCADDIPHLLSGKEMEEFLRRIHNAPTVCFIDEHGNLIGQPVVGNEPDLIRKEAYRLMESPPIQEGEERIIQAILFR